MGQGDDLFEKFLLFIQRGKEFEILFPANTNATLRFEPECQLLFDVFDDEWP
jgi:hypothetical protein